MNDWNGEDRRQEIDHDLLIELKTLLTGLRQDLLAIRTAYETHLAEDKTNFERLNEKVETSFERLNEKEDSTRWYVAVGLGIIGCLEFFKDKIFH